MGPRRRRHPWSRPAPKLQPEAELPSCAPPRPACGHPQICERENKCHSVLLRAILFGGGLLRGIVAAIANTEIRSFGVKKVFRVGFVDFSGPPSSASIPGFVLCVCTGEREKKGIGNMKNLVERKKRSEKR